MTGLLCVLVLMAGVCQATNVVKMSAMHSAVLEKFRPAVAKFAKDLTQAIGDSDNFQEKAIDVITKDLAVQVDQLVLMSNTTVDSSGGSSGMCCLCKKCASPCRACGITCCCNGSGGCRCTSCSNNALAAPMDIEEVDSSMSARKMWAVTTHQMLARNLRALASQYSTQSISMCCKCLTCKVKRSACGQTCCLHGKICKCKHCATQALIFEADTLENPIAIKPEVEAAIQEVKGLVNNLLIMVTM